jgi:hypothetical protein
VAILRLTFLEPRRGSEDEVERLLKELDATLANAPGLLMSFLLCQEPRRLGRIALWQSKDGANREAANSHVLSLRSRLRHLSVDTEERLLEITSGHLPEGFSSLQAAAKLRAYFPSSAQQVALPAD